MSSFVTSLGSTSMPPGSLDRLAGLDTLRTIAIFHVILAHGAMMFMPQFSGALGKIVWLVIATNFGVPLFFVLSGFLITRQLAAAIPIGAFYRNRFAKIYPMYLVSVLVFGLLHAIDDPFIWGLHIIGMQNISDAVSSRISGHLWSLAVEMQFYVLVPFLFMWVYRVLTSFLVAFLVVFSFIAHALWLLASPEAQAVRLAAILDVYQFSSFNFIALVLGAWLYRIYSKNLVFPAAKTLGILAVIGMPIICLLVVPGLRVDEVDLRKNSSLLALLVLVSLPPIASVSLVYFSLRKNWFQSPRWRPIAAWVAAISYQWYLWHPLILMGFAKIMEYNPDFKRLVGEYPWTSLAIYGGLSMALSSIAYRWLEKPAYRWLSGAAAGRPSCGKAVSRSDAMT